MTYLAVCLICVVAIELFIRLPFMKYVGRLGEIGRKTTWVIGSSKISDHWKEKVLQRYSRDMAVCSISLGFFLVIVLGAVSLLSMGYDLVASTDSPTLDYLMTVEGLLLATGFAFVYIYLRRRIVPT